MQSKEKEQIVKIYQDVMADKGKKYLKTLANTLQTQINDMLSDPEGILFELLQNADDASEGENKVTFAIESDYLLFSHQGKHFTEKDINKICDNAQKEHTDKIDNEQKRGYKGIGFKAIFSISDCVYIISKRYQFKFDKAHFKNDDEKVPWPIIPIWVDDKDIPDSMKKRLDPSQVSFIIKLKNHKIINPLSNFINKEEILLFQNNVSSIRLSLHNQTDILEATKSHSYKVIKLNSTVKSTWLINRFSTPVPQEIQKKLSLLSEGECPAKIKSKKKATFSFAAEIKDNKIVSSKKGCFFIDRPTKTEIALPFIASSSFLPNGDRTRLLNNEWNRFLLDSLAHCQFYWMSQLAKVEKFRFQVLNLLLKKPGIYDNDFLKNYSAAYERYIDKYSFITAQSDDKKLLKVSEAIWDSTEIFSMPGNFLLSYDGANAIINDKLENKPRLKMSYPELAIFDLDFLIDNIESFAENYFKTQESNLALVSHLFKLTENDEATKKRLKEKAFILSDIEYLCQPSEIYLEANKQQNIPATLIPNLIPDHPMVHSSKTYLNWLLNLGVKWLSELIVIRYVLPDFIDNKEITTENCVEIIRFVFTAFVKNQLATNDVIEISQMPLLNQQNELIKGANCYLSKDYEPKQLLENILNKKNLLSEKYLPSEAKDLNKWRQFFKFFGVKSKVSFHFEKNITRGQAIYLELPYIKSYLTHISKKHESPITVTDKAINHQLTYFVYADFMTHIAEANYAKIFWEKFNKHWNKIAAYSKDSKYNYSGRRKTIPSYLEFFLGKIAFLSTQNEYKLAEELFMPGYKELIYPYFSTAHLPNNIQLTKEQANYVGFKTRLDTNTILSILGKYKANTKVNQSEQDRYGKLLKELTRLELSKNEVEILKQYNGCLLAADNSFKPLSTLFCYAIPNSTVPINSKVYLKETPPLNRDDMITLAKLFNLDITNQHDVEITYKNLHPNEKLKSAFTNALPLIAHYQGYHSGNEKVETILNKMMAKIQKLQIYRVSELTTKSKQKLYSYLKENNLYYLLKIDVRSKSMTKEKVAYRFDNSFFHCLAGFFGLTSSFKNYIEIFEFFTHNPDEHVIKRFLDEHQISPETYNKLKAYKDNWKPHDISSESSDDEPDKTIKLHITNTESTDDKTSLNSNLLGFNNPPKGSSNNDKETLSNNNNISSAPNTFESFEFDFSIESQSLTGQKENSYDFGEFSFDSLEEPTKNNDTVEDITKKLKKTTITTTTSQKTSFTTTKSDIPFSFVDKKEDEIISPTANNFDDFTFDVDLNPEKSNEKNEKLIHKLQLTEKVPLRKKSTSDLKHKRTSKPRSPQVNRRPQANPDLLDKIGKTGELVAFELLKKKYYKKYITDKNNVNKFIETELGFLITAKDGNKLFELIWVNKIYNDKLQQDSHKPYDIKIIRHDKQVRTKRYIDVKASKNPKVSPHMSRFELAKAEKHKAAYRILAVSSVFNAEDRRFFMLKNPYEAMMSGKVLLEEVCFYLPKPTFF